MLPSAVMASRDQPIVELKNLPAQPSAFSLLQRGAIVVIRNLPEIRELGATLRRLAASLGARDEALAELLRSGKVADLATLSAFYAAFRQLRNSRYISCLFSDAIGSFGLPTPVLVDTGYCRMVVPDLVGAVAKAPELFSRSMFEHEGPQDAEGMLQGAGGGGAHRDIDGRHTHYQLNLWFPLHDLDAKESLLLFPEAYRRDVPQYGALRGDDPDQWGFGRAMQIPLNFGDTLVFHSQQLHASPIFGPGRSRFTVEIRVAGACIDDNASVYRRLFWNLNNFQAADGLGLDASRRAAPLAEQLGRAASIEGGSATTAHTIIHNLFWHSGASLAAAYLRRPPDVLDDAIELDHLAARRLLAALEHFPCGEDLLLLVARILWRQRHGDHAIAAVRRTCVASESYFWALEGGRLAAEFGAYNVAAFAFERAERLAAASTVVLDGYTPDLPPPRSPRWRPQLLPSPARRAAKVLARRARRQLRRGAPSRRTLDYQEYLRPRLTPVAMAFIWRIRRAQKKLLSRSKGTC